MGDLVTGAPSPSPAGAPVVDDTGNNRLVIDAGGVEAELIYRVRPGRLILVHTEVPAALEGHGLGGRLVQAAIDRAARTGETLVPWCPFARRWMREHPERLSGVAVDWKEPPARQA